MPSKITFGGVELTGDLRREPMGTGRAESRSVRIGLIGDFRGRGGRGPVESGRAPAARQTHPVDRDDIDAVLARMGAGLELRLTDPLSGAVDTPVSLMFRELDDFHPDRILARAPVFAAHRAIRDRLSNPATFAEAAAEIGRLAPVPEPPAPTPPPADVSPADLLDAIIRQSPSSSSTARSASAPSGALESLIDRITAPHAVRTDPRQAELIAVVDGATAGLLRAILHHPDFQDLESRWRAVKLLTRRLETGPDPGLSLELVNLTRAELEADLLSSTPIEGTAAFKLLVEPSVGTEGGRPWTFLVGDFRFGPSARDAALLWRLGQVARLARAPFLSAASPHLVGCDSLAVNPDPDDWGSPSIDEGWSGLRRSHEAAYLGLVLPRFLLRNPYGPASSPIEAFGFDELAGSPAHESYLWGNPAFAVAVLLGRSFDESGSFDPRRFDPELTDLPLPMERTADGETVAKPCAEAVLGSRAVGRLLDAGLMPLQSVRDRAAVRLAQLVSIADPPAPLALR